MLGVDTTEKRGVGRAKKEKKKVSHAFRRLVTSKLMCLRDT